MTQRNATQRAVMTMHEGMLEVLNGSMKNLTMSDCSRPRSFFPLLFTRVSRGLHEVSTNAVITSLFTRAGYNAVMTTVLREICYNAVITSLWL